MLIKVLTRRIKNSKIECMNTVSIILHLLWPKNRLDLRLRVVVALSCLAGAKVVNVIVPFFYKASVDQLSVQTMVIVPVMMIVAYGVARVFSQTMGELRDAIFAKVAQNAVRTLALNTFKHLHNLSLKFHLERQTGGLSRLIERGTQGMQFLLTFMLFNILPTLFEIGLVCGILYVKYNFLISAIAFVTIAGYIAFTLIITEWRIKYRRRMNKADDEANTKAIDSLLNYETVKYFNNEDHEYHRFDRSLQQYEIAAVQSQTSLSLLNVGQGVIISGGLISIMIMMGNGVATGIYTIGDFVLVNTFLIQLYMPLNFLGFVYRQIKQSLIDMEKMFSVLSVKTDVKDTKNAKNLSITAGEIKFKNVHFQYDERRPVIQDISFTIPQGHTLAIVGSSGAGKSTISRLIYRFYDIQSGQITIDGQNITDVTQSSLRQHIGIVPQDTVLFNDTIFYNISYGNPEADEKEVIKAARLAHIHDFIMSLPDQYDSMVGERGLKLSGGEKQRVAIARTILKNPPILIFDEATSALDTHTEKEIQSELTNIAKDHTTVIIAHRLSTIIDADEIIVLDDGKIAEKGTHSDLLKQKGLYSQMWRKQQEASKFESKLADSFEAPE